MGAFCHEIKPGRHTYTHRNVARAAICRSIFYLVITLIFFSSLLPLGDARSRPSKQQQHQQQHHFCVEKRKKREREDLLCMDIERGGHSLAATSAKALPSFFSHRPAFIPRIYKDSQSLVDAHNPPLSFCYAYL